MPQPASVFPHQLRLGDIVTDDQGHEWEVIGYPSVYNQGKSHQVRVKKLVGDHSIKSINFYSAHERVTVKRGRPGGEVAATTSRAPAVSTRVPLPNQPATAGRDEGVEERPRAAVVAQDLVGEDEGAQAADVEVAVGPKVRPSGTLSPPPLAKMSMNAPVLPS
jgi:hypothetical protein